MVVDAPRKSEGDFTVSFSAALLHMTPEDDALCSQLYYTTPQGMKDLLQALDTDGRLDLLPTIWKGEL